MQDNAFQAGGHPFYSQTNWSVFRGRISVLLANGILKRGDNMMHLEALKELSFYTENPKLGLEFQQHSNASQQKKKK